MSSPLFVCGCGHSGTTLLLAMLLRHSQCTGLRHETNAFLNANESAAVEYFDSQLNTAHTYFVEKTPSHVHCIATMRAHWPNCKIVVCLRNPLDVTSSLVRRGYTLDAAIDRYARDNMAWLNSGQQVIVFRYEDLIANATAALEQLCRQLDLPFEENMLRYHESNDMYFGTSSERFEVYRDRQQQQNDRVEDFYKVGDEANRLYRNYQLRLPLSDMNGKWRNTFDAAQCAHVNRQLHDLLPRIGYAQISCS